MDIDAFAIGLMLGAKNSGSKPASSPWTKLAEQDFTVNTTSSSATAVGTISCGAAAWTKDKMVYVRVRDKAGKRDGYYYGSDTFIANYYAANDNPGSISTMNRFGYGLNIVWRLSTIANGIYVDSLADDGTMTFKAKYNSTSGTIDGTYHVEVYTLEWPDNVSPFA